jgi:HAD superfamily hydrolase (TIGR01509 family)
MNISGFDLTHTLAFVFDLDGTLVQSEHVWSKAKNAAAKKNGLKLNEADLEPFVGRSLTAFVSHFFMNFSDEHKNHLINEIQTTALSSLETEMTPIKGASELLKTIFENGFRLALCSSASRQTIFLALEKLKAQEYFEIIVSGDVVQNSKPNPEPYERVLEELQVHADQAVAIEDSQSGFQSAIAAKIPTIVVHQYKSSIFKEASLSFRKLSQIELSI